MFQVLWTAPSKRIQRAHAMSFCASQFVTEGEVKYCIARIFATGKNGPVEYETAPDY